MTAVSDLIKSARAQVDNVDAGTFARRLREAVVVDLREPAELEASGMIPGAIHIPRGMLEFRADATSSYYNDALAPEKPVLLYCASGGRSALAGAALKSLGYCNVGHLDGGFNAWKEAGLEIAPAP
jgi:rhodanese-related sulfurtransferase